MKKQFKIGDTVFLLHKGEICYLTIRCIIIIESEGYPKQYRYKFSFSNKEFNDEQVFKSLQDLLQHLVDNIEEEIEDTQVKKDLIIKSYFK